METRAKHRGERPEGKHESCPYVRLSSKSCMPTRRALSENSERTRSTDVAKVWTTLPSRMTVPEAVEPF